MTTPEEQEFNKYAAAIQALLNDGMSLEELEARMSRYLNRDYNDQANIMNTMLRMRRGGCGEAFSL